MRNPVSIPNWESKNLQGKNTDQQWRDMDLILKPLSLKVLATTQTYVFDFQIGI